MPEPGRSTTFLISDAGSSVESVLYDARQYNDPEAERMFIQRVIDELREHADSLPRDAERVDA